MKLLNVSSSSYFLCISSLCVSVVTGYYIGYKQALSSGEKNYSPFFSSSISLYQLWAKKKKKESEEDGIKSTTSGDSSKKKKVEERKSLEQNNVRNSKEIKSVKRALVDIILPYPFFSTSSKSIINFEDKNDSTLPMEKIKKGENENIDKHMDKQHEQYKRQLLINDILLDQAVKGTMEELYVLVHDPSFLSADHINLHQTESYLHIQEESNRLETMRQLYLSELYPQLWDIACCLGKHTLKIVILYAKELDENAAPMSSSHKLGESKDHVQYVKDQKEDLRKKRDEMIMKKKIEATFGLPMSYILNNESTLENLDEEIAIIPSKTMNDGLLSTILTYDFHLIEDISPLCGLHLPTQRLDENNPHINANEGAASSKNNRKYNIVCVGGTFDRLHNGHKKLLQLATSLVNIANPDAALIVGVTNDEMLSKKKNKDLIANMEKRCQNVHDFLDMIAFPSKFRRVEIINDPFGPPIHEKECEAIIVSSETFLGGVKINEIRREKGMKNLELMITRRTQVTLLSSTFIRDKEP